LTATKDGFRLTANSTGIVHTVPKYDPAVAGHNVPGHHSVRCEACHAAWTFGDFGQNLIRLDMADYYRWSPLLPQGIEEIDTLFQRNLGLAFQDWQIPVMADRATGIQFRGVWLQAWDFRSFETTLIGLDGDSRLGLLRPFMQLCLSHVSAEGAVRFDQSRIPGGFDRYTPHTIRPSGAHCERCHGNKNLRKPSDLGLPPRRVELMTPGGRLTPGTEILPDSRIRFLENPSLTYRRYRARLLPSTETRKGAQAPHL
jgi:hypothetical protein